MNSIAVWLIRDTNRQGGSLTGLLCEPYRLVVEYLIDFSEMDHDGAQLTMATPAKQYQDRVAEMATIVADDRILTRAFAIIEKTPDIELVVCKIRDLLDIDHVVYNSSKLGASPSADPYVRLTYPASWIKRYLLMGYQDIDPVLREGFQRTLPFAWNELTIQDPAVEIVYGGCAVTWRWAAWVLYSGCK